MSRQDRADVFSRSLLQRGAHPPLLAVPPQRAGPAPCCSTQCRPAEGAPTQRFSLSSLVMVGVEQLERAQFVLGHCDRTNTHKKKKINQ